MDERNGKRYRVRAQFHPIRGGWHNTPLGVLALLQRWIHSQYVCNEGGRDLKNYPQHYPFGNLWRINREYCEATDHGNLLA